MYVYLLLIYLYELGRYTSKQNIGIKERKKKNYHNHNFDNSMYRISIKLNKYRGKFKK